MITQVVKPFDVSDEQHKIKLDTQLTAGMEETLSMTKARFMINDILDDQPGQAAATTKQAADFYLPVMAAAAMAAYRPGGPALSLAASDTDLKEVANSDQEDLGKTSSDHSSSPILLISGIFFRTLVEQQRR